MRKEALLATAHAAVLLDLPKKKNNAEMAYNVAEITQAF
jgi:hypothetical protein